MSIALWRTTQLLCLHSAKSCPPLASRRVQAMATSKTGTGDATAAAADAAADVEADAATGAGRQQQQQQQQQQRTRPTQGQLVERVLVRSPAPLVDIGANLCDRSFDKDREAVLQRAAAAGVAAAIVTGTCVRTSRAAAELCASELGQQHNLYFTAGVHPHNAKGCDDGTLGALRELARHPRCVAIGELGLDFNRNFSPPEVQERWFAAQLQLAEEVGLPLFLHCRDAGDRFAALLAAHRRAAPGVAHCFTGGREELETLLALGLHIGITGWVCDDRPERGGAALAALLPLIPDDRLLIETDCPYLTPRTIAASSKARPQRNEPALLPHVLHAVAAARGEPPHRTAALATANALRLFGLPLDLTLRDASAA